jgi:hypothetical protein
MVQVVARKNIRPYWKSNYGKRPGGVTEVVELLPSKCEALSSSPSTDKNKKRKERKTNQTKKKLISK